MAGPRHLRTLSELEVTLKVKPGVFSLLQTNKQKNSDEGVKEYTALRNTGHFELKTLEKQ